LVKLADESWGDLARYIDRVLRGANPADLPVRLLQWGSTGAIGDRPSFIRSNISARALRDDDGKNL
jgi:hypothetical protein